jgi:hypothetical protein
MKSAEPVDFKAKMEKYLKKAAPRFENLKLVDWPDFDRQKVGKEFLEMAQTYYSDAKHFKDQGDYANALAALEYAEGWLDAGRALGIFKVK